MDKHETEIALLSCFKHTIIVYRDLRNPGTMFISPIIRYEYIRVLDILSVLVHALELTELPKPPQLDELAWRRFQALTYLEVPTGGIDER